MNLPNKYSERHTIPRWNSISTAALLGETQSIHHTNNKLHIDADLAQAKAIWNDERNLPAAVDFVAAAKMMDKTNEAEDAILFIKEECSENNNIPKLIIDLIDMPNSDTDNSLLSSQNRISSIKQRLLSYPNNAILWIELARQYLLLGQNSKCERALTIARGIAPDNRLVTRATSRYYAHVGDVEKAHYYAKKNSLLKYDPWILANEVAIANINGKTSLNMKVAQSMLEDQSINPRALSELASEIGTMEFFAGNTKKGKNRCKTALVAPHENAAAQVAWLDRKGFSLSSIIEESSQPLFNYEANAHTQIAGSHDWNSILDMTEKWSKYQPFSAEPVLMGSFICTHLLSDYNRAIQILEKRISTNQNDYLIKNNYIFALAMSGDINLAQELFNEIPFSKLDTHELITLTATKGLLCYRQGLPDDGLLLYLEALKLAKENKHSYNYYVALICLAREEKRLNRDIQWILDILDKRKEFTNEVFLTQMISSSKIFEH